MGKLTAFMIVRNARQTLPRCLASLGGVVDAVVVLDTGSDDGTCELLAAAAADSSGPALTWERLPFTDFSTARRAALARVRTEWALWIDADEFLSEPLRRRLRALIGAVDPESADVWAIRIENRVLGRTMRGRNLGRQFRLRLFRRGRAEITADPVHEGLAVADAVTCDRLAEPIVHETMRTWRAYLAKVDLYTTLETRGRTSPYGWLLPLHLIVTGPATLWREYAGRGGWRDGWPGAVWALTTAWSSVLRDTKFLVGWFGTGRPRSHRS